MISSYFSSGADQHRRRSGRTCSSRWRWRIRSRSRRCRGSGAAWRCCDGRSSRSRRRRDWAPTVSGLCRCGSRKARSGTLSGILRMPSMSSEKQSSRVGTSRQQLEGAAHHGGARHFAEGADMRQARRTIAGFEQHFVLCPCVSHAREDLAGFLKRPGLAFKSGGTKGGIDGHFGHSPNQGACFTDAARKVNRQSANLGCDRGRAQTRAPGMPHQPRLAAGRRAPRGLPIRKRLTLTVAKTRA